MRFLVGGVPRGWIVYAASAAVLSGTAMVVLFVGRFPWWGSPMAAVDWAAGTNLLVGPVAAGIAALLYANLAASGWLMLLRGTRRGMRAAWGPAVMIALAAVTSLAVSMLFVVVVARQAGTAGALRGLWIVGPTGLALCAQVVGGAVVGSWLGRWWLAPAVAFVAYAAQAAGAYGWLSPILVTGPASTLLVERTFSTPFAVLQGAALAALTVVCGCALSFHVSARRPMAARGLLAVGLVGFAAALVAVGSMGAGARYTAAAGVGFRCAGTAPEVCMSADTVLPLEGLSEEFATQAAALRNRGIDVPSQFVQQTANSVVAYPQAGVVDLQSVDAHADRDVDPALVSWSLANPAPCPEFLGGVTRAALMPRVVLADWIATQSQDSPTLALSSPAELAWLDAPSPRQRAWVASTYAALRACDLVGVRLPWHSR